MLLAEGVGALLLPLLLAWLGSGPGVGLGMAQVLLDWVGSGVWLGLGIGRGSGFMVRVTVLLLAGVASVAVLSVSAARAWLGLVGGGVRVGFGLRVRVGLELGLGLRLRLHY